MFYILKIDAIKKGRRKKEKLTENNGEHEKETYRVNKKKDNVKGSMSDIAVRWLYSHSWDLSFV